MSDIPPPPGSSFPPPPPSGFPPPHPAGSYGSPPPPGYSNIYGALPVAPMRYGNVFARLGAVVIDGLIGGLLFVPAIIAVTAGPKHITSCSVDDQGNITIGEEINALCEVPTGGTWAVFGVLLLAALVGLLLYHTLLIGRTGQTLGKKALGLRVVDATNGGPIGSGRALGRFAFATFISGNICGLGYLWAIWDQRNQTWHDKVVSSVVVEA